MTPSSGQPEGLIPPLPSSCRIGCVSFLNARPLIEGLNEENLVFDVPSGLLAKLETGTVDIALCPVIDFYRSSAPLQIIPVGGIGCCGPTLTVKLCSRVPIDRIRCVHADTDSHTSIALLQVVLHESYGRRPQIVPYHAKTSDQKRTISPSESPESVLLIGDKVVKAAPQRQLYSHQIDLGDAWYTLTKLPFVFAVWMARQDTDLGDIPAILNASRLANTENIDAIASRNADKHGWPSALARLYLADLLQFAIDQPQLDAIEVFAHKAHGLGLIAPPGALRVRHPSGSTVV